LTTQLGSIFLLTVGELVRNSMKMFDVWCLMSDVWCLMSGVWYLTAKCRESKSRRYTVLFGTHILQPICRTEESGSSDKANRIASSTSSRLSSLGDHEASPEFRTKIQRGEKRLDSCLSFSGLRIVNGWIPSSKLNQFLNQSYVSSEKICP
jgi:hypothetical protein